MELCLSEEVLNMPIFTPPIGDDIRIEFTAESINVPAGDNVIIEFNQFTDKFPAWTFLFVSIPQ
jgi:hypothetical protein